MNPAALRVALRLRQAAVASAQLDLAGNVAAETAAAAAARDAAGEIQVQADAASALTADDLAVEAFAAWLPRGRRAESATRDAHSGCLDAVAIPRAALAVARAAEEAVANMLEAAAAAARAKVEKATQAALDEAGQRAERH